VECETGFRQGIVSEEGFARWGLLLIKFTPSLKVTKAGAISFTVQIEFEACLETETEADEDKDENEFTFWMALRKSCVNVDF
jgi:hypothetical protein